MKDIDFDELDKAVNSLMATAPVEQASADDPKPDTSIEVPTSTTPTTTPAPPVPAPTAAAEAVTVTTSTSPAPATPSTPVAPAVKRAGRFMDMVHASSDMKPRVAAAPTSREGITIAPRPESAAPAAPTPLVSAEPTPTAPAPEVVSDPKTPDIMPDPLDLGNPTSKTSEVESSAPDSDSTAPATGESPFIPDAKVEKRPLNPAASALDTFDSQMANELNTDDTADKTEPTETSAEADEPPATPQVPELSSDLVAIESNEKIEEPVATQGVDTKDAAGTVETAVPLGATSIAKQYRAQPSTGDQSHAAIYDASEYPEPVKHPAKKKSGWLWVLWVVLLLGLGAGIAVALYFLGIIP